jgi:hypothetical protein
MYPRIRIRKKYLQIGNSVFFYLDVRLLIKQCIDPFISASLLAVASPFPSLVSSPNSRKEGEKSSKRPPSNVVFTWIFIRDLQTLRAGKSGFRKIKIKLFTILCTEELYFFIWRAVGFSRSLEVRSESS